MIENRIPKHKWSSPAWWQILLILLAGYLILSIALLPDIVRSAQLAKITSPFTPRIAMHREFSDALHSGMTSSDFTKELEDQGFRVSQDTEAPIRDGMPDKTVFVGTRLLPRGLLQILTISNHELRVIGYFKNDNLTEYEGYVFWQTL